MRSFRNILLICLSGLLIFSFQGCKSMEGGASLAETDDVYTTVAEHAEGDRLIRENKADRDRVMSRDRDYEQVNENGGGENEEAMEREDDSRKRRRRGPRIDVNDVLWFLAAIIELGIDVLVFFLIYQ